jgi:predicted RNA-binding protein with PUA-like domain
MKSEPSAYSIDDLERDRKTSWEGVRNYQARNLLRDELQVGDDVLFYASSAKPPGVVGLARVCRAGYPDPFAWQKGHKYFDPDSDPAAPTWYLVDIEFVAKLAEAIALDTLKATKGLENMMVTRRGARLSVQPVAKAEFEIVLGLARGGKGAKPTGAKPTQARNKK